VVGVHKTPLPIDESEIAAIQGAIKFGPPSHVLKELVLDSASAVLPVGLIDDDPEKSGTRICGAPGAWQLTGSRAPRAGVAC
jgi:hypothetical protein